MLIIGRVIEGIGLGTAPFAFRDGTPEDSVATMHAALDAGVMLIDGTSADRAPASSPMPSRS
jgi:aryl-alcohol dehydrogenase-like predicted oxidoreductase